MMNLTDTEKEGAAIEHDNVDGGDWGEGPWSDEPDYVQWIDESTGLVCVAARTVMGHLCGYTEVPADHDWHERGYDDLVAPTRDACPGYEMRIQSKINVHGGVTYAGRLDHLESAPSELWFFGFDCAHCDDVSPDTERLLKHRGREYRDIEYVIGECRRLSRQIAEWEVEGC